MSAVPVRDSDGQPIAHLFQIGGQDVGPAPIIEEQRAIVVHKTPAVGKPELEPLNGKAIVSQLRARLRVVEREIKARKALEEERDALKRLIHAAKTDRDNVRRIRAAG